jgi:putative membrane protein
MFEVRERVPTLTAVLTLVSLALVFGAVGGAIPAALLPRAPETVLAAIPTVNALVSAVAIVTIVTGVRAIRRGHVARHRRLLLAAFALLLIALAQRGFRTR